MGFKKTIKEKVFISVIVTAYTVVSVALFLLGLMGSIEKIYLETAISISFISVAVIMWMCGFVFLFCKKGV